VRSRFRRRHVVFHRGIVSGESLRLVNVLDADGTILGRIHYQQRLTVHATP